MTPQTFHFQRTLLCSAFLGLSVLLLSACGDKTAATPAAESAQTDPANVLIKPEMANQFKVSKLEMQEITPWLEISGRIEANDRLVTRIGASFTGRVTEVLSEVGDRVQRGQALARVASSELTIEVIHLIASRPLSASRDRARPTAVA